MNLTGRLERVEKAIGEVNPIYRAKTFNDVDAEIFRDQLEGMANVAVIRNKAEFDGSIQAATDGELPAICGFSDDEEGRARFRNENRAFYQVLKHNRNLPHICSEFCPSYNGHGPTNASGQTYFLADVRWHLGWFQRKGVQPSIAQAVTLYIFCQRNSRARIPDLLKAFDELQATGWVFDDWDYPEISVSEAVQYIYDENKKTAKPGDDPYSFRLPAERKT
jgi:hypothetical protein